MRKLRKKHTSTMEIIAYIVVTAVALLCIVPFIYIISISLTAQDVYVPYAFKIIPWVLYRMYGDVQTMELMYGSMKKWIDFMQAHSTDEIWTYKLQFGDWVALDAEEGSYFGATPTEIVCTAYYAHVTELFARMAGILNKPDDQARYAALHDRIAAKFRSAFFAPDGHMTAQTQTAHILALHFHLAPEPEKTARDLVALLEKENFHLKTGFVGTPYVCFALSENGYVEEAYRLLLQTDIPSWLYQVRMGATTVWEHWDSVYPDGTMWSADMNSQNHYAYGSIGEWIFRGAAGIHTAETAPAFAHSILRPLVSRQLPELALEYDSLYGTIMVKWDLTGDKVTLDVRIPENTTATLELVNVERMLGADGGTFTQTQDAWKTELGSGQYRFVYELKK